jgi:hypothetical protein
MKEHRRSERQVFHLLATGALPARRVGGRWAVDRSVLRKFFRSNMAGAA